MQKRKELRPCKKKLAGKHNFAVVICICRRIFLIWFTSLTHMNACLLQQNTFFGFDNRITLALEILVRVKICELQISIGSLITIKLLAFNNVFIKLKNYS